jgi:hypothetical protein
MLVRWHVACQEPSDAGTTPVIRDQAQRAAASVTRSAKPRAAVESSAAGGLVLDGGDRMQCSPLPFEDADDLFDGQALGLRQEPEHERDGGQAQGREADHDAGQADGVLPDREDLDEREVGQPVDGGGDRGHLRTMRLLPLAAAADNARCRRTPLPALQRMPGCRA